MLSDQLTAKRGPLARVWLASHWERKISKSQFLQTNLEKTIDAITTNHHEPLTLRISGQLLLGIVRIYSRKTRYLLEDCNDALVKIKMAFKKGDVNMPDINQTVASVKSITLPEKLTEFGLLLPDAPVDDIDLAARDPIMDSFMASSQDITLSDASFGYGGDSWDFNPTAEPHLLDEAEQGRVDELDVGFSEVEQGRRDQEPGLEDSFTMDQLQEPLNKLNLNDISLEEDILDFDFDFGNDAPAQQEPGEFQMTQDLLESSSVSTLMQSGIERDYDMDTDQIMFDTAPAEEPTAQRRRKRRLVVDKVTEIAHEELRRAIRDTSAIVDKSDKSGAHTAPPRDIDWRMPVGCRSGTGLESLFVRMQRRRRGSTSQMDTSTHEPNLNPPEDANNTTTPAADTPAAQSAMDYDTADMDFGFDTGINFDADDQQQEPAVSESASQGALNDAALDQDGSFMTQSSQSTLRKSTHETLTLLQNRAQGQESVAFGEIVSSTSTKSEAARRFYDILLLTTKDRIKVKQVRPFGQIQIRV